MNSRPLQEPVQSVSTATHVPSTGFALDDIPVIKSEEEKWKRRIERDEEKDEKEEG